MSQLIFHVTSAKAIASQVLAATPDPSHWRDSFERGAETLNYFKQVLQCLHPTGYNYPVQMDKFFHYFTGTGTVTEWPNPRGEKQHQVPQPLPKLLLKKLSKLSLHRVHQQVNLQTCIDQALHPSNRTCMPMIAIMLT